MAPPGIWTKIDAPDQEVMKLFDSQKDDANVLWFQNGDGKVGLCQRCAGSTEYARSFQMAGTKLEKLVEQECVR